MFFHLSHRSLTGSQTGCCRASFELKYYHSNLCVGLLFVEPFCLAEVGHVFTSHCQVSLSAWRQLLLLLPGKFQEKIVPLNTHSFLGMNQTLRSSGWVLGFAPDWVMMGDIVPSGFHCFGLAGAADVWLRLPEKYGCSSVGSVWRFLWKFCISGVCQILFFTLSQFWPHHTTHAYNIRPHQTERRRVLSGQWRTFTSPWGFFFLLTPFSPHNALSRDSGVQGPALLAVMDGPWGSTVATMIGWCW